MPKHIHKYQGALLGKDYEIYRCMRPACTHYIKKSLGLGRETLCHGCEEKTIIRGRADRLPLKPLCDTCRNRKKGIYPSPFARQELPKTAMDIVDDILSQVGVVKK